MQNHEHGIELKCHKENRRLTLCGLASNRLGLLHLIGASLTIFDDILKNVMTYHFLSP